MWAGVGEDLVGCAIKPKDTAELRQIIVDRGKPLGLQGKYPGLSAAVDGVLAKTLGLAVAPVNIDAAEANSLFQTMAWQIMEVAK
jgi:hypothetical protein